MQMQMQMEGASDSGGLQTQQHSLPMRVEVDVRAATTQLVLLHPTVASIPTVAALLHDTTATQPPTALWTTLQTLLLQVRASLSLVSSELRNSPRRALKMVDVSVARWLE
jgi:hypothetical protein